MTTRPDRPRPDNRGPQQAYIETVAERFEAGAPVREATIEATWAEAHAKLRGAKDPVGGPWDEVVAAQNAKLPAQYRRAP